VKGGGGGADTSRPVGEPVYNIGGGGSSVLGGGDLSKQTGRTSPQVNPSFNGSGLFHRGEISRKKKRGEKAMWVLTGSRLGGVPSRGSDEKGYLPAQRAVDWEAQWLSSVATARQSERKGLKKETILSNAMKRRL